MPVNGKLFTFVQKRLNVSDRHVHRLIERTAGRNHLPRNLALLLLASEHDIPTHRFATDDELAQLRSFRTAPSAPPTPTPATPRRSAPPPKSPRPTRNNSIFVVHGRDAGLTEDIYSFLRAIGIHPMEWNDAIKTAKGGATPIVGDVINQAMKKVQGVLVLLAPDEEAKLRAKFVSTKDRKHGLHVLDGQPRPNVIFEAGLALGAHSEKTILVQVGDIREISDIAGKHMVHLSNKPASRKTLALRLRDKLKFKINIDGDHWLEVGDFDR